MTANQELLELLREARKELAGWYDHATGGDHNKLEIIQRINSILGDSIEPLSDQS